MQNTRIIQIIYDADLIKSNTHPFNGSFSGTTQIKSNISDIITKLDYVDFRPVDHSIKLLVLQISIDSR